MPVRIHRTVTAAALMAGAVFTASTGCSQDWQWAAVNKMIESDFPHVDRISTDSLARSLSDSSRVRPILLDTRERDEYDVSHIRGAIHVDPDAEGFPFLDSVDVRTPIVAYCSVGYRSSAIVERLRKAGFENATNLEGSIFRWANEGRPVVRNGTVVREVHPYDRVWGKLLDPEQRAYAPGQLAD